MVVCLHCNASQIVLLLQAFTLNAILEGNGDQYHGFWGDNEDRGTVDCNIIRGDKQSIIDRQQSKTQCVCSWRVGVIPTAIVAPMTIFQQ